MNHREMLIGGHFIGGPCDQSVSKIVVKNPYSGSVFGTAAEASPVEASQAVGAAADAFPGWSNRSPADRGAVLYDVAQHIRERETELVETLVGEVGKPIAWAEAEVRRAAITFELSAQFARSLQAEVVRTHPDSRSAQYEVLAVREPLGPILGITPYNWPINLAAHKIGPALALGNTIVIKGSEKAPLCTYNLARVLHDAGVPPGVLNAIVCDARVSESLVKDSRLAAISFTGSPTVGWHIKDSLPRQPVFLELGGDAYAVLTPSTLIESALPKLVASAFGYAGQVCISLQHILVHESIAPEVIAQLTHLAKDLPTGDPALRSTVCGPMINGQEALRVMALIDDAIAHGALVACGHRQDRNVVWPTVLINPKPGARILTEEAFGPVLTVRAYTDLDEAIRIIEDSQFALHASIFSQDDAEIEAFVARANCGGIIINDSPSVRFDAMPYGGNKDSGFGREGVGFAAEDLSRWKSIVRRSGA